MKNLPAADTHGKQVDLTGTVCPMTLVKARMGLARVLPGETIEFILREGDQLREVPKSLKEEGHRIEGVRKGDDRFLLTVRKQV